MFTRRRIILLVVVAVLILSGLLCWIFRPEPEPSYRGRLLSKWVVQRNTHAGIPGRMTAENEAALVAIRHIGTNAVPYLVKWATSYNPSWRSNDHDVRTIIRDHLPSILKAKWMYDDEGLILAEGSVSALAELGSDVKGTIPGLAQVLNGTNGGDWFASDAAILMLMMGRDAVPPLIQSFTNKPAAFRRGFLTRPSLFSTTYIRAAVAFLKGLLEDPDPEVRERATNALLQIAPEVLTSTPSATPAPPP